MSADHDSHQVLIAGGGVAAIEAGLALNALTGGSAEIAILAPGPDFIYRPMTVLEPFEPAAAPQHDLGAIAAEIGAELIRGSLARIDREHSIAHAADGRQIRFDRALVALGARRVATLPTVETLWVDSSERGIDEILDDAAAGGGLSLIVPTGVSWALPLYEFALMARRRSIERGDGTSIEIFTPEREPLAIFGPKASDAVAAVLGAREIGVHSGCQVIEAQGGGLKLRRSGSTLTGYPLAMPGLEGGPIEGLPRDGHGFIPIDGNCRVRGAHTVFAAGDGADFPVKQGGIATQQADAAAAAIAADLGFDVEPEPFHPVLRGRLLTGAETLNLRTEIADGHERSEISPDHLWWPPHKISGRYLAPWLAARSIAGDLGPPGESIDIDLDLTGFTGVT